MHSESNNIHQAFGYEMHCQDWPYNAVARTEISITGRKPTVHGRKLSVLTAESFANTVCNNDTVRTDGLDTVDNFNKHRFLGVNDYNPDVFYLKQKLTQTSWRCSQERS